MSPTSILIVLMIYTFAQRITNSWSIPTKTETLEIDSKRNNPSLDRKELLAVKTQTLQNVINDTFQRIIHNSRKFNT